MNHNNKFSKNIVSKMVFQQNTQYVYYQLISCFLQLINFSKKHYKQVLFSYFKS